MQLTYTIVYILRPTPKCNIDTKTNVVSETCVCAWTPMSCRRHVYVHEHQCRVRDMCMCMNTNVVSKTCVCAGVQQCHYWQRRNTVTSQRMRCHRQREGVDSREGKDGTENMESREKETGVVCRQTHTHTKLPLIGHAEPPAASSAVHNWQQ